jgi:hypothetical protein
MKSSLRRILLLAAVGIFVALLFSSPLWGGGKQSFSGQVSDAMCGRKHMEDPAADCTRSCVQHGSKYSLIVGDKERHGKGDFKWRQPGSQFRDGGEVGDALSVPIRM